MTETTCLMSHVSCLTSHRLTDSQTVSSCLMSHTLTDSQTVSSCLMSHTLTDSQTVSSCLMTHRLTDGIVMSHVSQSTSLSVYMVIKKKYSPKTFFGIFSLCLSLFSWNFADLLFSPCQVLSRPIHPENATADFGNDVILLSLRVSVSNNCTQSIIVSFFCLSNAMHRHNINLPLCVCMSVCVHHTFCQLAYRSDPSKDCYSW